MDKKAVYEVIDSKASEFAALSDAIWDYAELAFTEHQSAEALCRQLEKEGFAVTRGVAGIETAFTARYGSGKPVIGVITKIDLCQNPEMIETAKEILEMAGAEEVITVGFGEEEGIRKILEKL